MKNPHYYDQEKVTIERVKLAYVDGSDQDMTIRNFESGAYSSAGVYPTVQTLLRQRKNTRTTSSIACRMRLLGTIILTLIAKHTIITAKTSE